MKTDLYGQRPAPPLHYAPRVTSYATVRQRLETTPPNKLRPTHRLMGVSPAHTIREGENGDVIVRIAQTDHVIWHRDGTVTVTGLHRHQWAYNTLPEGVRVIEKPDVIMCGSWWERQANGDGSYGRNKSCLVAPLAAGDSVTLRRRAEPFGSNIWEPIEEMVTGRPLMVPRIDTKRTRAISREYRLVDFKAWLTGVLAMTDTSLAVDASKYRQIADYHGEDPERALELSKAGEFAQAYGYLPMMDTSAWGHSANWHDRWHVTPSSVDKLRHHLYSAVGAVVCEPKQVCSLQEYQRIKSYGSVYDWENGQ